MLEFDSERGIYVQQKLKKPSDRLLQFLGGPGFLGGGISNLIFGLHFEGANNSTTFAESGARTATVGGNSKITTTDFKFGSSCGIFDGNGDYLSYADNASLELGTVNFGIGCFFKTTDVTAIYRWFISKGAVGTSQYSYGLGMSPLNKLYGFVSFDSTKTSYIEAIGTTSVNNGAWHYAFFGRSGNSFKLALDGVQEGLTGTSSSAVYNGTAPLVIGGTYGTTGTTGYQQCYNGKIDEVAIYTKIYPGFNVPTEKFVQ